MFCLLLNLAKGLFAWYIANFCAYGVIFGDLEKMIILLIWVFYVAFIFLFCAELIAAYERRDLLLIEKTLMAKNEKGAALDSLLFRRLGRFYKRGALVIAEGDRSADLYYILSGEVNLTRKGAGESQETTLRTLGTGSFFGEMAAVTGGLQEESVYAATDSDIACIDASTLRRLIRENERFTIGILLRFAQNAREATKHANSLAFLGDKMVLVSFFAAHPQGATPETALANIKNISGRALHAALSSLQEEGILVANAEGRLVLAGSEKATPLGGL